MDTEARTVGKWAVRIPLFLPPATKLWEGNMFTPVCDSVHTGVSVQEGDLCLGKASLSRSGILCSGGGSLSLGVSVQGVSLSREVLSMRLPNW